MLCGHGLSQNSLLDKFKAFSMLTKRFSAAVISPVYGATENLTWISPSQFYQEKSRSYQRSSGTAAERSVCLVSFELTQCDWVSFRSKGKRPSLTDEQRDTSSRSGARALQGRRLWCGCFKYTKARRGRGSLRTCLRACVRLTDSECRVPLLGPLPPSWIDVSCAVLPVQPTSRFAIGTSVWCARCETFVYRLCLGWYPGS